MSSYDTFDTPLGRFTIAVDADGAVQAAGFGGLEEIRHLLGPREPVHDAKATEEVRRQIEEYFAGERTGFDLKLAEPDSDFQRRYRGAMAAVEYGKTTSYGELAARLGSSARATGRANATNPLCIIVPCHRIIGADGSLTGYAYGLDIKRRLLEHEGAFVQQPLLV
jgi:methylated-DNA-[protein]-cysteine S-methyltransferase